MHLFTGCKPDPVYLNLKSNYRGKPLAISNTTVFGFESRTYAYMCKIWSHARKRRLVAATNLSIFRSNYLLYNISVIQSNYSVYISAKMTKGTYPKPATAWSGSIHVLIWSFQPGSLLIWRRHDTGNCLKIAMLIQYGTAKGTVMKILKGALFIFLFLQNTVPFFQTYEQFIIRH